MSFLMAVLLSLLPQQPGLPDIVDGVVRTYSKMNDFSAEFEQTTQDISNQRHTYRGLLYLKSGKKMLLEQTVPDHKFLYSDGKWATDYKVGLQAERTPVGKTDDERLQLFQIPWNPEWKNQFDPIDEPSNERPTTAGHRLVRLFPKKKDLPVILLEVDPKTFLIHRFRTTSPDGEINEFSFKGIKTTRLDPSIFEFKAPPGVEVIENKR